MTGNHPNRPNGVGAREAGRQLGVSHSYLIRLAKDKRLPRSADGTFDVEECRRVLASTTDPSQVRRPDPLRWSHGGHSVNEAVSCEKSSKAGVEVALADTRKLESIPSDPPPDIDDYRNRTDLPDDFARGALYGAHAVAYHVPHTVAFSLWLRHVGHEEQIKAFHIERDAAHYLAHDVTRALGLDSDEQEEPTAFSPVQFMGYGPGGSKN